MIIKNKTIYLWDLAGTLFPEEWNIKKTGFNSYSNWLQYKLGKRLKSISDREYETGYQIPYTQGWYFNLKLVPHFKKVLSWTKHNETFSTGNKEQVSWRAQYLNPKIGFDLTKYFQKLNSTFDYGKTNKKTKKMLVKYLDRKYQQGYKTVVYTDDKLDNLVFFKKAGELIKNKYPDFSFRLYNIFNSKSGLKNKKAYHEISGLLGLLANEKKLIK